jgi:hypothetical protein
LTFGRKKSKSDACIGIGFFMRLARAVELTHIIASPPNSIEGLDSLLDPALVEQALEQAGVATPRGRRLPLEMMLWCVISMAFFRRISAWGMVSRMNIMLPGQRPILAPGAVVQARQRLGSEAVRQVFDLAQKNCMKRLAIRLGPVCACWALTASSGERPTHLKAVRVSTPPTTSMVIPVSPKYAWSAKWS